MNDALLDALTVNNVQGGGKIRSLWYSHKGTPHGVVDDEGNYGSKENRSVGSGYQRYKLLH